MLILVCLVIASIFLFLRYREAHFLESKYTKEELFKLCREVKVYMYGCITGRAW